MMDAGVQKITMRRNYLLKGELIKLINSELPQTRASILALNLKYQQAPTVCQVPCSLLESEDSDKEETLNPDHHAIYSQMDELTYNSLIQ